MLYEIVLAICWHAACLALCHTLIRFVILQWHIRCILNLLCVCVRMHEFNCSFCARIYCPSSNVCYVYVCIGVSIAYCCSMENVTREPHVYIYIIYVWSCYRAYTMIELKLCTPYCRDVFSTFFCFVQLVFYLLSLTKRLSDQTKTQVR